MLKLGGRGGQCAPSMYTSMLIHVHTLAEKTFKNVKTDLGLT